MNLSSLHSSLQPRRLLYPFYPHILSQSAACRPPPLHKRTASHNTRSKPSRPAPASAPPRPPPTSTSPRPPAPVGRKIADADADTDSPNPNVIAAQNAKPPFSWKRPLARLTRRSKITVLVVVATLGLLELAWYSQLWARYRAGTTFEAREERQRQTRRERWRPDG